MKHAPLFCALPLVAAAGLLAGCVSSRPPEGAAGVASHQNFPDGKGRVAKIEPSFGPGPVAPWNPEPKPTLTQRVGESSKGLVRSVSNALTIKPREVVEDDPVSLASEPGAVGSDVFVTAGKLLENRGDFNGAQGQYRKALAQNPADLDALVNLARLHERQGAHAEAETLYLRALAAHPRSAVVLNDLGVCYARQNKHHVAVDKLRAAADLEPGKVRYRNNLAAVLVDLGRAREAWDELRRVHAPAVANYNLGCLLYERGRHDDARRCCVEALAIEPRLDEARQMLAHLDELSSPHVARADSSRDVASETQPFQPQPSAHGNAPTAQPVTRRLPPVHVDP